MEVRKMENRGIVIKDPLTGETRGIEPDGVHITRTYAFNPQISGRPYKIEQPEKIDGASVTIDGEVHQTRELIINGEVVKGYREIIGLEEPTIYWTGIDYSRRMERNTASTKRTPSIFFELTKPLLY